MVSADYHILDFIKTLYILFHTQEFDNKKNLANIEQPLLTYKQLLTVSKVQCCIDFIFESPPQITLQIE